MSDFWHRPDRYIDKRSEWHAYEDKLSLCGVFFIGVHPADATNEMPAKDVCVACSRLNRMVESVEGAAIRGRDHAD